MGATNRRDNPQHKHADKCRLVGKMAVLTLCGECDKPVVGVVVGRRQRYCMECKSCGFSASSHFTLQA